MSTQNVLALLSKMAQSEIPLYCHFKARTKELGASINHGKIVEGGRLIVPAAFRKEMGLAKGDAVVMEMHGDELRIRPAKSALKRLREKLHVSAQTGASVVDEFIAERRRDSGDE